MKIIYYHVFLAVILLLYSKIEGGIVHYNYLLTKLLLIFYLNYHNETSCTIIIHHMLIHPIKILEKIVFIINFVNCVSTK